MAAPVPTDKIKDKEYSNWLKVTLALYYMKTGLHTFIQNEVDCLHQSLVQKIYGSQSVPLPSCTTCHASHVQKHKYSGVWTFSKQCKSYCGVWLNEFLALHTNPKSEKIYWDNSDVAAWPFKPWECAKVFMPRGQLPSNVGPTACDAQAMMTLLASCQHFHHKLSSQGMGLTRTISTIRNKVMHDGEMKLSDADRRAYIQQIIQFLEDPKGLKSLDDCKVAVGNIQKINNDSLDICFNLDIEMTGLKSAVNELRLEHGIQEKRTLDTVDSLKEEIKQHREQMTKRVEGVESSMETLEKKHQEMHTIITSHGARLNAFEEETSGKRRRVYNGLSKFKGISVKRRRVCNGLSKFKESSAAYNYTKKELLDAWQSIEECLLEELAPKNLLTFFEKENLLSEKECRTMRLLSRSQAAKKLLQSILAKLPEAFFCLLHALNETKQELIVQELGERINNILKSQLMTHNDRENNASVRLVQELEGSYRAVPIDALTPAPISSSIPVPSVGSMIYSRSDPTQDILSGTMPVSKYGLVMSPTADVLQVPASGSTTSVTAGPMQSPSSSSTAADPMQASISGSIASTTIGPTPVSTADVLQAPASSLASSTTAFPIPATTYSMTPSTTVGPIPAPSSSSASAHDTQVQASSSTIAVEENTANYTLKLELLKNEKTMHEIESKTRGYFDRGRIVFEYDMKSQSVKWKPGSVIVYLRTLSKCTKETLAFFCHHGGMKDFVLDLLKKKDIFASLPEGEMTIRIQVYYDIESEDAHGQCREVTLLDEKDVLTLHDSSEITDDPQTIRRNLLFQYGYLVEEIDPLQFQDTFVTREIWDTSFFEQLKTLKRRRARAADFLNKLLAKGDMALAAFVHALRSTGNDNVADRLCFVPEISAECMDEGQMNNGSIEVVQEESATDVQEQMLWSCQLVVVVRKNEEVSIEGKHVVVKEGTELEDKKVEQPSATSTRPEERLVEEQIGKGESGYNDKDSHTKETDTTAASKDMSPFPQPTSIIECTSQSIQVFAPYPQPSLISPHTPQFILTQPELQPSVGKSESTPSVFGDSQGQARKSVVLQDEMEFLEAMKNDSKKVQQMIRSKMIPKRSIIETVVKQDGYSQNIQMVLREMSNLLREIPESVCVWCGYKPNDPFTPVFVVTLKSQNCILSKTEILELFIDYSIIIQYKHVPNDEERSITEKYGSKTVRSEDVARLNNFIAEHTQSLMTKHSNLSIIRPCPVKSRGYLLKQLHVIEDTCIVFYVPVKGIIPIGEKEFPTEIDGIATDVREGEFYFFGSHNAMEYHQKLRMGCGITGRLTGSLGGFVDLPDEKVGCLTAAHVVLNETEIQHYISLGEEEKRNLNNHLARGSAKIEIYQPTPEHGRQHFGRVHAIALDAGNIFSPSVDAAIIQITDDERKPEIGIFPDGDFEDVGFTAEDPMSYTSGKIMDDIDSPQRECLVIKYGCTTGITRGCLEWIGESVRPVETCGSYSFPVMMGQLEVNSYNFAAPGDSGALVFLCLGGNIRNLHAVGMIIGGTSTGCQCFITPIKAVFEKLGLMHRGFKCFPHRELSEEKPTAQPLIKPIGVTRHLRILEQKHERTFNDD